MLAGEISMYRSAAMQGNTEADPTAAGTVVDPWASHPTDDGKHPLSAVVVKHDDHPTWLSY